MASVSFPTLFLILLFSSALLFSPSSSQKCTSQKFRNNKLFANCTDLPVLDSHLHFTYNSSNSSLSIAFIAPPAQPEGWVSWAINPTATGMIGSQAFIAFISNGSVVVNTYNISSYSALQLSELSFNVWDLSAESDGKNIVIFATVKLPEKAQSLNQVWQVGASVSGGRPNKHDMAEVNLHSKGLLELVGGGAPAPAPAPGSGSAPRPSPVKPRSSAGIRKLDVTPLVGLFVLLGSFVAF
ncbi:auxin-induced in root cultures protein 12 [Manihot esculenta]|uniref:DOMON domain-containing protein n=1 Tax=Manihot esculenta TaxID=3983 RepID=A0A2C9UP84_MANES|nr:auxin-induced in root cultures protein 12 [Manihot esculenta]OAY32883.1 hypothetical protein MANES_13G052900v8 [Manihot esculenta]